MARIAGVNIPADKGIGIALTYIYGIGRHLASEICEKCGIDPGERVNSLSDAQIASIRSAIDNGYNIEGNLRRDVSMNIKHLLDLGCYKGLRHRYKLPVRGQRTHTNARTRKGPAKPIAGKKM